MNSRAIVADSFITFPRLPVIVRPPFPLERILSMNKMSPPTLVQAKPVTTPGTSVISDNVFGLGTPRISSTFSIEIFGLYCFSIASCKATQRAIPAILFSKVLTPLSEVCASMICFSSALPIFSDLASKPFS